MENASPVASVEMNEGTSSRVVTKPDRYPSPNPSAMHSSATANAWPQCRQIDRRHHRVVRFAIDCAERSIPPI